LIYEEREEEVTEPVTTVNDMDEGLKTLIKRYGLKKVMDTVVRVSKE
jgi:hypothetical protein